LSRAPDFERGPQDRVDAAPVRRLVASADKSAVERLDVGHFKAFDEQAADVWGDDSVGNPTGLHVGISCRNPVLEDVGDTELVGFWATGSGLASSISRRSSRSACLRPRAFGAFTVRVT
jgi:hypothetical protein